ncbi:MAG: hypothetical protein BMS9Abin12_1002 [Acidimicrobiia bacterium]|nr:MAG: hypothetical protein BMS9Abin12_1002 [Acidimicrobiia bacterium]
MDQDEAIVAQRTRVLITSTADGSDQPCYLTHSEGFDSRSGLTPLVLVLHPWSSGVEHRQESFEAEAIRRDWILLVPHFRGRNDHPDACGSIKAQQDILDAVEWAKIRFDVDPRRVYLTGASGGGHMTMLMASRHPTVWAAASAWVGISDLSAWHQRHEEAEYGEMLRKVCGGRPGDSKRVDTEYRQRSPLTFLHRAARVPLDIAAGIHDGHQGSVPIRHSLEAFNETAKASGDTVIAESEITQLSAENGRLTAPHESDLVEDETLGRAIYLRRHSAFSRVTIFEGGHEGISTAAFDWLSRHIKPEA